MATFETFALQCAAGVALDLLAAIASVESGMRPLAVRDGDKIALVQSAGEGVAAVVGITDQGREPGIGLMGVTPRQLRAAGLACQPNRNFDPRPDCNVDPLMMRVLRVASMVRPNAWQRLG